MYSHTIKDLSYCVDVLDLIRSEECYYCSFSTDLYDCTYVTFSQSCSQSQHLSYCVGVKYSSYCVGLENVTYHILNKSYTKEEYIEKINNMSQSELLEQYEILYNEYGKPPRIINCENVQ
ncbi:MAG: hypothetical protein H6766_03935 [Candidatus Peribacteria bacterium]|nr:MAG: hypothetical protein H6766_03935 [Candidatus Peribacteria bacterium]